MEDDVTLTFAEEAGIELDNAAGPLFQLLTLCMLQAKPITSSVAVAAARGLFAAGLTSPRAMVDTPSSTFIQGFGRAGYARYDVSTTARLKAMSERLLRDYDGDLRALRAGAPSSLQLFDGVGPACARMFAREAQRVWPELAPVFDAKALQGARILGLPEDPRELAAMSDDLPRFAARLVRAALKR